MRNLSKNIELTKERINALMKSATARQKLSLTTLFNAADDMPFHHVCSTGEISLFVVTVVAREFNVDPFYLTGEADVPLEFIEQRMTKFKIEKGFYGDEAANEDELSQHERTIWYEPESNIIAFDGKHLTFYICEKCMTTFTWRGKVERCVACRCKDVRTATDKESAEYRLRN